VVPAALAAAEAANATGPVFLRALLHGYEVTCRLGEVFRGSQFYHGVHPTALCGVFGAAAWPGLISRRDRARAGHRRHAGLGLTEWRRRSIALHPAARRSGSRRLAAEGFTDIFEGERFFNAYSYARSRRGATRTRRGWQAGTAIAVSLLLLSASPAIEAFLSTRR
jgi:2-methylcitrate dehydratase PrpD